MHEQHLLLADQHIVEAEMRVTRQRVLIDEMVAAGHDTALAEALLTTLLQALNGMRAHRATILAEAVAERGKPLLP
jgi:Fe2+ or Zn2+ uptake regulation protein